MARYVVADYWVDGYAEGDDDSDPTSLFIDPKYRDAEPGRDFGNDRARTFLNSGGSRTWGNDR